MRRATLCLLLVVLVAGCSFREDTVEPPNELTDFDRGAEVTTVWAADTGWGKTGKWVGLQPRAVGNAIVAANVTGEVTAFARDSGEQRWSVDLDTRLSAGVGAADDDAVFVGTADGTVVDLDPDDGSVRWRHDVDGAVLASPVGGSDGVIVRTVDGRVLALDPDDGERRWSYRGDVPSLSLRGNSRPLTVPGGILVGFDDGKLMALAAENGRPAWRITVAEPTGASPVQRMVDIDGAIGTDRSAVYAASYQGRVTRIQPKEGRVQWGRDLSSYAGLHVSADRVYVSTSGGDVLALDTDSGATVWRQKKLAHRRLTAPVPIAGSPFVAVADFAGYVHILTRTDGRIVNRRSIGSARVLADPIPLGDGRIAVQTRGDDLAVLEVAPLSDDS